MGFVAPAGTPLSLGDLAAGWLRSATTDSRSQLQDGLRGAATRQCAWLFSTGRAAMTVAFEAMKRVAHDPRRVEVVIAGYTCYSVPAAAERAGLVPRLCDVDPVTLSPDLDSLSSVDFGRVLTIVSANLYGLPNALTGMEDFARRRGIFMLDDAAQALGARNKGRAAGSFGDVGLFSFDKGKNITSLQGGALVADPGPLSEAIESIAAGLETPRTVDVLANSVKLLAYAALLRPWLYGVARRLPLGLGLTPYETDYPVRQFSRVLEGLVSRQLERLGDINGIRSDNARRLRHALADVRGIAVVSELPDASPVYARFPVLVDPDHRSGLIAALESAGIGATASYPRALIDVPEVARRLAADQAPTPGARTVASRIMTLPTHGYSPRDLGSSIAAVANATLSAAPASASA